MKICRTCQVDQPLSNFYAAKTNKDGLQNDCKSCWSLKSKSKYEKDEAWREHKKNHTKAKRLERLNYVWDHLKEHPCIDCGERDIRVLDFDHVRGEKTMGVTRAVQQSLKLVKQEIDKCEVRCANCHRIKTYAQLGWRLPEWIGEYNDKHGIEAD